MSYLKDFLNEHENWEELLSNSPYNLKIVKQDEYILFKYSMIASDFSLPVVRDARGIVLTKENGSYIEVARPFSKFFNYGEPNADFIDWESPRLKVTEKIDGTLINLWYHNGWHLSTNGTINAFKASISGTEKYFGDVFVKALAKNGISSLEKFATCLDKKKTHMFELVSLDTKVVIPYELNLYYLTSRDTETGEYKEEEYLKQVLQTPKSYDFTSIKEVETAANNLDWGHEGFVVFDGVNRLKLKSPEYILAHFAGNNGVVTKRRLLHLILIGETEEFLSYFPEYGKRVKELEEKMKMCEIYAAAAKTNALEYFKRPRAEYVEYVHRMSPRRFWDFLFKCYDQHDLTFKEYSEKFSSKKWEEYV